MFLLVVYSCINKPKKETLVVENNTEFIDEIKEPSIEEQNGLLIENLEIIGKWIDQRPATNTIITLIKDVSTDKYYIKNKFSDGSEGLDKVRMSKYKGLDKIYVIGEQHGEYYIIEKNKCLGMYGQNGKFNECITF